jgi:para-nitrobenzyl esterase
MLFIHGGGNNMGSSIQPLGDVLKLGKPGPPIYEGQRLVARGKVVVVTINYRLGVLGYLIHADLAAEDAAKASGNYGIRDQIAALRWVKQNIGAFGGDPARVTIFGQSGGGRDVVILTASPVAKGLFHRAVAHSAPWNVHPQSYFLPLQAALLEELGCDKASSPITCLRGKSAAELVTAKAAKPLGAASFPFHPSVDGYLLKAAPSVLFAGGEFNRVPFMAGTTEAEHSHWEQYQKLTKAGYDALMKKLVAPKPARLDEAKALYDVATYGSYSAAYVAAYDDRGVTCSTVKNIALVAQNNTQPTYLYRFRQVLSTAKRKGFGAYHTSDLLFLFQHMGGTDFSATADERRVEAAMAAYWSGFAASGKPSGASQPSWPAHTVAKGEYQSLEPTPRAQLALKQKECAFWWSLLGK